MRSEQFNTISRELSGPHHLHPQNEVREDGFDQVIICALKGLCFHIEKYLPEPLLHSKPAEATILSIALSQSFEKAVFPKHTRLNPLSLQSLFLVIVNL